MGSSRPEEAGADRRFLARLVTEAQGWQSQGIITPEQARSIISSYGVPPEIAASRRVHGRVVTILAILGSVLVGLGVILFFAANWDAIPKTAKLALIMIGIPAAYATGYWLKYHRGYERVGTAVLLLAAIIYGAGIHLVAQAYNFPVNDPNLLAFWFLGVIPLAYLTRSPSILVLAIGLFLSAVGFRFQDWLNGSGEGIAITAFALYLVLGLMIYGLGKLQEQYDLTRPGARAFELLGLLTIFGSIYLLGFRGWFDSSDYKANGLDVEVSTGLWVLFYVAVVVAAVGFVTTGYLQFRRRLPLMTLPYEGAAALLFLAAAILVANLKVGGGVFYPILFNALLFPGVIGLMFVGYFRGREAFITITLILFSLGVISRYFELSWDLLDRSVIFIVAGIILLAGGFILERARRKVFERMGPQEAA